MGFSSRPTWGSSFSLAAAAVVVLALSGCGLGSDLDGIGVCDRYPDPVGSPYKLPFAAGSAVPVEQANCEPITHWGRLRYAYDFHMSEGEPVLAMRGGTVLHVNSAPFSECLGNHVYIQHDDGTIARYLHFTDGSIVVARGAAVNQGDLLGGMGATGCTGAFVHLHVDVVDRDGNFQSMPFNFRNVAASPRRLEGGRTYVAL